MNRVSILAASAFALTLANTAHAETVFMDSFESGDMSASNAAGFNWGSNNRTSVVTEQGVVYSNGEKDVSIPSGRNWEPKHEDHSLRFRYAAGKYMSEQRFDLGKHYNDIWLSYWIRVPVNFTQGSLNSKFLSIWPQEYDRAGTITWQTRPNGTGGANIVYQDGGVTSGEVGSTQFISVPADRGRWMHIVARAKAASGPNSNDGVIQFYRRWEEQDSYTKIHEKTNADTWDDSSSQQGISQGYILGWANDAYDSDTEWLVDQFAVHTESPIGDFADESRPNPPVLTLD